jgi:hypothetical protein
MTALKKRADALENEFAYRQEFMFKAQARSNALLGLWAASAMHRPDAEHYSREIALADVTTPGGAFARLRADFDSAGIHCSDEELRDRMVTMLKNVATEMHRAV